MSSYFAALRQALTGEQALNGEQRNAVPRPRSRFEVEGLDSEISWGEDGVEREVAPPPTAQGNQPPAEGGRDGPDEVNSPSFDGAGAVRPNGAAEPATVPPREAPFGPAPDALAERPARLAAEMRVESPPPATMPVAAVGPPLSPARDDDGLPPAPAATDIRAGLLEVTPLAPAGQPGAAPPDPSPWQAARPEAATVEADQDRDDAAVLFAAEMGAASQTGAPPASEPLIIEIGAIEIRLAPAARMEVPTPARRDAGSQNPVLALSDYLAGRSGGGTRR